MAVVSAAIGHRAQRAISTMVLRGRTMAALFAQEDEADEAEQVPEDAEDERDVLLDVLRDGREADEHDEGPDAHEGDARV